MRPLPLVLLVAFAVGAVGALAEDARALDDDMFTSRRRKVKREFEGFVTHGINVFYGKKLYNFSKASHILEMAPVVEDIGIFNPDPGAFNASRITEDTPEDAMMASVFPNYFHSFGFMGFPTPMGPFNVPIYSTPTFTTRSFHIEERYPPAPFEASDNVLNQTNYAVYRKQDVLTLGQYNSARGHLIIVCERNGRARFKLRIEGIPLALYTAWDVMVTDAHTPHEFLASSPFGGIPNVIATDRRGFGEMSRKLNYCPLKKCRGSERCSAGIILAYHFDNMVYGAGTDLGVQGFGLGNAAAIHMMFAINGKPYMEPPVPM